MMAAFGVDAALLTLAGVAAVAAAVYACIAITSGPK